MELPRLSTNLKKDVDFFNVGKGNITDAIMSEPSKELHTHIAESISLYIAILLSSVIIIVGCVGNIMVVLAVKCNKKLQTVSNKFVVNLSICDLLFVTMVLPFNIYTYIEDGWYLNKHLCKFIGFLGYTLTGTTIITITLIAWNRYKLVLDPSGYKRIFVSTKLTIMMVCAWIFPIICLIPALMEIWGRFGYVDMLVTCNLVLNHDSQSFKLFLLICRAVVPCFLIVYYYLMILYTTRKSHRRIQSRSVARSALEHHNHRKEMHLTRMMLTIFIVFILSYFPCTISSVVDWNTVLSKRFHMFCIITVYVGSALNPLIYGLMNSQFRLAYFKLLSCHRCTPTKQSIKIKHQNNNTPILRNPGTVTTYEIEDSVNVNDEKLNISLLKAIPRNTSLPDIYRLDTTCGDGNIPITRSNLENQYTNTELI